MNSGASCRQRHRRSGCGWPFAVARARSWPGVWVIAASKARRTCGQACRPLTVVAPPAAIFGERTEPPFRRERTAAAAKPKARPATSNAGFARCASVSAAWFAKPCLSPSAPKITWTPSTCSSPPTTSPSNSEQQKPEHYQIFHFYSGRKIKPVQWVQIRVLKNKHHLFFRQNLRSHELTARKI